MAFVFVSLVGALCAGADDYITVVDLPDAADFQPMPTSVRRPDPSESAQTRKPSRRTLPASDLEALRSSLVELRREIGLALPWSASRQNRIRLGCEFAAERRDVMIVSTFVNGSTYRFSAVRRPDASLATDERLDEKRFHAATSYHRVDEKRLQELLSAKPGFFTSEDILSTLGRPALRRSERRNGNIETSWLYEFDERLTGRHGLDHRLRFVLDPTGTCLAWEWTAGE